MKIQNGFTLVELAIVMVIIGVLLGGVLKGQELVTNSKASATVADIKNYEAAVNTFQDAYDEIPGDIPNPSTRLPNCPSQATLPGGACSFTELASIAQATGDDVLLPGPGSRQRLDNVPFFVHLAAADLIGGVDTQSLTANRTSWAGGVYPEAPIGGGFHAGGTDGTSNIYPVAGGINVTGYIKFPDIIGGMTPNTPRRGLWLALHGTPGQNWNLDTAAGRGPVLQPSHALRIDNKIDDGSPYTGFVRGAGTVGNTDANCATATDYNGVSTQPVCFLYIRLGG